MFQNIDYQIKSTPYFQRMLTTSKKNGQLQNLKKEYERLKEFNEQTIESKLRKVRLKRLFKEIDEIKNAESKKRRLDPNEKLRNKTEQDKRLENLVRAKNLGQYFSKQNILGAPVSDAGIAGRSRCQFCESEKLEERQLKARVAKRITYGNQISSWNMQKMLMDNLRKGISSNISKTRKRHLNVVHSNSKIQNDQDIDEIDKSKQGISYSNTIPNINTKNTPMCNVHLNDSNECITSKKEHDSDSKSSILTLKGHSNIIMSNLDAALFKSCDEIDNGKLQPMISCYSSKTKAKMNWNKLASLRKNLFDMDRLKKSVNNLDKYIRNVSENQLRSMSNDTDLLQNNVIPMKNEQLNFSENEDDCNNEIFVCSEYFDEVPPFKISHVNILTPPPPPLQHVLGLKAVQKPPTALIEHYEPYIRDVVNKEVDALGFQTVRKFFEYRN